MNEMVERVAKAIHAAQYARIHDEALGLTDLDVARSAIAAMQEPTDAMIEAAEPWAEQNGFSRGWRAAINEALK